jgi:hypothetical protein
MTTSLAGSEHILKWLGSQFPGSYALLSANSAPDAAMVFVHGFLGDANETWLQTQWMIDSPEFSWWGHSDLFFLHYRSFRDSIDQSAYTLLRFVDTFFPRPPAGLVKFHHMVMPMRLTKPDFVLPRRSYRQLYLVGHSEGAVVIRRAVTIRCKKRLAVSKNRRKMLSADLALFAPAQGGFTPSGLKGTGFAIAKKGLFVLNATLNYSPAFVEMKDGRVLQEIRTTTEKLADKFSFNALRARVLFGEKEDVVARPAEYYHDVSDDPQPGHDHTSICKPIPGYITPLEFISKRRKKGASGC